MEVNNGESDVLHKLWHCCEPEDLYEGLDGGRDTFMALLLGTWAVLLSMAFVVAVQGLPGLSSSQYDSSDLTKSAGVDVKKINAVTSSK